MQTVTKSAEAVTLASDKVDVKSKTTTKRQRRSSDNDENGSVSKI